MGAWEESEGPFIIKSTSINSNGGLAPGNGPLHLETYSLDLTKRGGTFGNVSTIRENEKEPDNGGLTARQNPLLASQ